jgi:hypothetical protein
MITVFTIYPVKLDGDTDINNVFRPNKTLKKTRIKLYNTLDIPIFYVAVKIWPSKQEM